MRRHVAWMIVVVAGALIQTTWLEAIQLQGVLPDLTLLLVVFFAINEGEERAMFTGVLGGVYQDVAGATLLGHHVVCHVLVGYAVGRIAHRMLTDHPAVKAGLVLGASLAHGMLFTCIAYVQAPELSAINLLFSNVIPQAFYTALLTPVAFFVLARLFGAAEPAIEEE